MPLPVSMWQKAGMKRSKWCYYQHLVHLPLFSNLSGHILTFQLLELTVISLLQMFCGSTSLKCRHLVRNLFMYNRTVDQVWQLNMLFLQGLRLKQ